MEAQTLSGNSAMMETRQSLLRGLQEAPNGPCWQRFVDLYQPLLYEWVRPHVRQGADAENIVQEVLLAVVREMPAFRYDPTRTFRGWLRTILHHRLQEHWRARRKEGLQEGDESWLDQLADPESDLSRRWDREHDQYLVKRLLEQIEPEFDPVKWTAFRRVALDGEKPADVARDLSITENVVYITKHKVLRRLREELEGLVDHFPGE